MAQEPNKKPENDSSGMSRRRALGIVGAGVGAIGAGAGMAGVAGAMPRGTSSPVDEPGLTVEVVDYVDRHYVLRVTGATTRGSRELRMNDGLRMEVTSGAADIRGEKYTGTILVKPKSGEAVAVRAVAPASSRAADSLGVRGASASQALDVGYDAADLSEDEIQFDAGGGGACSSTTGGESLNALMSEMGGGLSADRRAALDEVGGGDVRSNLRVRAAVMANVIPRSPTQRIINWRHARYYGRQSVLGLLRFTYDKNRRSTLVLDGGEKRFFPAKGLNSLYCRMEMLELGIAAITDDPMLFPSASVTWPPYSTPMNLAKPVVFHDENDPDKVIMTIVRNEMKLYDYNGVTIKKVGSRITADGTLRASFEVSNQTDSVLSGRWVLLGDHQDRAFERTDAPLTLGPARSKSATTTIDVEAPVRRSELSQRVSFAVLGLSDPIALGITPLTFKFPHA